MSIHEMYGRMAEENQRLAQEYKNLLGLLDSVRTGKVDPARIEINMAADSWTLLPDKPVAEKSENGEWKKRDPVTGAELAPN